MLDKKLDDENCQNDNWFLLNCKFFKKIKHNNQS